MIDVTQDETYAPGDTIRAVLRFRWDGEFDAVKVELHRTSFGGAAYGNPVVCAHTELPAHRCHRFTC